MQEFFTLLTTFPVVLFSAIMAVVFLYWILVILGTLDVDLFDLDGVTEAIDGALDGALDGAIEGGLEAADGLEGGAEGAGEGTPSGLAGVIHAVGLHGVPLTISLSILFGLAWLLSMLLIEGVRLKAPEWVANIPLQFAVLLVTLTVAGFLTARIIRPLRPAFATVTAPSRGSFTGRVCTVVSTRVDGDFGRAEIDDGGAGLLVDVRCAEENTLSRGDYALVYDYDREADVFLVKPAEDGLSA